MEIPRNRLSTVCGGEGRDAYRATGDQWSKAAAGAAHRAYDEPDELRAAGYRAMVNAYTRAALGAYEATKRR